MGGLNINYTRRRRINTYIYIATLSLTRPVGQVSEKYISLNVFLVFQSIGPNQSADLVIELPCPSVCLSVCLWQLKTPSSGGRGDFWSNRFLLMFTCHDTIFFFSISMILEDFFGLCLEFWRTLEKWAKLCFFLFARVHWTIITQKIKFIKQMKNAVKTVYKPQ